MARAPNRGGIKNPGRRLPRGRKKGEAISYGPRSKLSLDFIEAVCADVRAGVYPSESAAANGVMHATFYAWMTVARELKAGYRAEDLSRLDYRGFAKRNRGILLTLLERVTEAEGAARQFAEKRVYVDDPKYWLRVGPGRDRGAERPGWTERQELTGAGGGPIETKSTGASIFDEIGELAAAIGRARGRRGDAGGNASSNGAQKPVDPAPTNGKAS
jgi:hypothetical protein